MIEVAVLSYISVNFLRVGNVSRMYEAAGTVCGHDAFPSKTKFRCELNVP